MVSELLLGRTSADCFAALLRADVPVATVSDMEDLLGDPASCDGFLEDT